MRKIFLRGLLRSIFLISFFFVSIGYSFPHVFRNDSSLDCSSNIIATSNNPETPLGQEIAIHNHFSNTGNFAFPIFDQRAGSPTAMFQARNGYPAHIDSIAIIAQKLIAPEQWISTDDVQLDPNSWDSHKRFLHIAGHVTASGIYQLTIKAHDADTHTYGCSNQVFSFYVGGTPPQATGSYAPVTWQVGQSFDSKDLSQYFTYDQASGPLVFPDNSSFIKIASPGFPDNLTLANLGLALEGTHIISTTNTPPIPIGNYTISVWCENDVGRSEGGEYKGAVVIPLTIKQPGLNPPIRNASVPDPIPQQWGSTDNQFVISVLQSSTNAPFFKNPTGDTSLIYYDTFINGTVKLESQTGDVITSLHDLNLNLSADGTLRSTAKNAGKEGTYVFDFYTTNDSHELSTGFVRLQLTTHKLSPIRDNTVDGPPPQEWKLTDSGFSISMLKNTAQVPYFKNPPGDSSTIYYDSTIPGAVTIESQQGNPIAQLSDLNLVLDQNGYLHSNSAHATKAGVYVLDFYATNDSRQLSVGFVRLQLTTEKPPILSPPMRTSAANPAPQLWNGVNGFSISMPPTTYFMNVDPQGDGNIFYDNNLPGTIIIASQTGDPIETLNDLNLILEPDGILHSKAINAGRTGSYTLRFAATNNSQQLSTGFVQLQLTTTKLPEFLICPSPSVLFSAVPVKGGFIIDQNLESFEFKQDVSTAFPTLEALNAHFGPTGDTHYYLREATYDASLNKMTCEYRTYAKSDPSQIISVNLNPTQGVPKSDEFWSTNEGYSFCDMTNTNHTQGAGGQCDLGILIPQHRGVGALITHIKVH